MAGSVMQTALGAFGDLSSAHPATRTQNEEEAQRRKLAKPSLAPSVMSGAAQTLFGRSAAPAPGGAFSSLFGGMGYGR